MTFVPEVKFVILPLPDGGLHSQLPRPGGPRAPRGGEGQPGVGGERRLPPR